jgi:heme A synthase
MRSVLDVRYLALLSSLATYALIVLGGTVRATDSGLACPDWPRCHGQFIPPLETNILIEYSHRLAAASVGLLIVGMAIAAWLWYRDNRFVLAGAGAAVALLIATGAGRRCYVNLELPDTVVALHLSIALMLLAILIATAVGAVWGSARGRPPPVAGRGRGAESGGLRLRPLSPPSRSSWSAPMSPTAAPVWFTRTGRCSTASWSPPAAAWRTSTTRTACWQRSWGRW